MWYLKSTLQNQEFEYPQQNNKLHFSAFSAHHEYSGFQFEDPSINRKLTIIILMEEVKPIVTEKCETE